MKRTRAVRRLLIGGLITTGLAGITAQAYGAHPTNVVLRDVDNNIAATSGKPYSPKFTCGTTSCHDTIAAAHGVGGNIYEADWALSSKTQYNRDGAAITYEVPYPQHGVSAGYHFQQGRNHSWDATKQEFYHVAEFTSSPGMYGKY
jgi:hypothetical protein